MWRWDAHLMVMTVRWLYDKASLDALATIFIDFAGHLGVQDIFTIFIVVLI